MFATSSYETVGSTGAGKALNLARLGHEVHLHTLIGDDDTGRGVVVTLARSGVCVHQALTAGPTERHVNLMPPTVHDNDALDDPWPLSRTLNAGGRLVVCTRGAKGAIAVDANGLEHAVDAVPVGTMIDSNGAGDAFTAGLIHGLVDRGWRLDRALRAAAIAGATAVRSRSLASDRLTAGLLETA